MAACIPVPQNESMIKETIKKIIKSLPVAFTRNQKYDRQTSRVIRRTCKPGSNCIDVGAHKGEVLDFILKCAPEGTHFAFEPIPLLYEGMKKKYAHRPNCRIYNIALSNEKGTTSFNYVVSNPSYSGLIKRKYDRENEEDLQITVATDRLDHIIPGDMKIDLVKIDVEGGELLVLEGAKSNIRRCRPVFIFEKGLGALGWYGATSAQVDAMVSDWGIAIN